MGSNPSISAPSGSSGSVSAPTLPGVPSSSSGVTAIAEPPAARSNLWKIIVPTAAALLAALVAGGLYYRSHRAKPLTDKDTIVLADFANSTGDAVFNDTLRTALTVSLNQSPFLNVLPENKVAAQLKLMARPAGTALTPDLARELCQRSGSKAYIAGSIAGLGSQYVVGLKAVTCQTGDVLAQEQATAAGKEKVLDALGEATSKLRGGLGESLASVQKYDVPLAEATTNSLEALQAYSQGKRAHDERDTAAGLPYMQRAIELDSNFALGYQAVATSYQNLGELERASSYYRRAFELREHASERERMLIDADYYANITGELDKAFKAYQTLVDNFPQETRRYNNMGIVYGRLGQYEKALSAYQEAIRLHPDVSTIYVNVANTLTALQRFDEARDVVGRANAHKLDNENLHFLLYGLAFLKADHGLLAEQQKWLLSRPEYENDGLSLDSDTEAFSGHAAKARELSRKAADSAVRADSKEGAALWSQIAAVREAAFGNFSEARQQADAGLTLFPSSQGVQVQAAVALAMAGDSAKAESLAQDLNKRFPLDTQLQGNWLPAIRAQLALNRKNPASALEVLKIDPSLEFGQIAFVNNITCLYPTYIRGEAYLAANDGKSAAAEFQKIITHDGMVWNCWTGALAKLGVARANALQAKTSQGADADAARVRALNAYKDFLTLWKDADPDIPILRQAKAEYAKLQ